MKLMRSTGMSVNSFSKRHETRSSVRLPLASMAELACAMAYLTFFDGRQVFDLVGDLAVLDAAVRRLEEAVLVGARVDRQRVDEADVRTFRRFDRAHAAVVRRMHVAHFEAGAFARQTTRAKCRNATLVRDFRQRVVLVHELRELRGAEEFLHRGRDRLGVDHFLRHERLGFRDRQALLDGALDAHEADAEGVLRHFADAAHAAVAEVVDVVHAAFAVADADEDLAAHRARLPSRARTNP